MVLGNLLTYAFGHLTDSSAHNSFVNIHPNPGKKSVRYKRFAADSSMLPTFPLSFHADIHQSDESFFNNSCVPKKYS